MRGPCQGVISGTSLYFKQLSDICQPTRTLAEDIVRIHYQETTSEDIEDFMCAAVALNFSVQTSEAVIFIYSWELCVLVFSKSNHQSKPRL
jgi:hypothetical protein